MPLYEYECGACGHRFETIRKFTDKPLERCPKCDGPLRKLQSAPAFQFKGTGWYLTDYARKDKPEADKPEKPAKAEGGSKEAAAAGTSGGAPDKPAAGDSKTSSKPSTPGTKSDG
jgi:putative FmdB family regulatory protein